jgi:hypothetical protein
LGSEPTLEIVDGSFHYQLMVGPDALPAEDAFGEVPLDEGVDLLGSRIVG